MNFSLKNRVNCCIEINFWVEAYREQLLRSVKGGGATSVMSAPAMALPTGRFDSFPTLRSVDRPFIPPSRVKSKLASVCRMPLSSEV